MRFKGQRFALREGGRTIAAGVISKILPDDPEPTEAPKKRSKWLNANKLFKLKFVRIIRFLVFL